MSDTPVFDRVTVLGAGTMGSGIAQICAQTGSRVCIYDIDQSVLDNGVGRITQFVGRGVTKGKMSQAQSVAVLQRICTAVDSHSPIRF